MSQISAHVRLRPIRFAFLVRPDDRVRTLEIFRTNTCLWGGKFNPIIPFFKQVPKWWDRHNHRFESAVQIVNGYLDFFEPDFLVEAEPGLADTLGFDKERILQLTEILTQDGDRKRNGSGLSVLSLYKDLYRTEYQFARRHEHDIVKAIAGQPSFDNFSACIFGDFPKQENLRQFDLAFTEAFDPKLVLLNGKTLEGIYRSSSTSALRIGQSKIEVDYHSYDDPALFVLDAHQPRDLIDFWNLRAIRPYVIPVPVQWVEELSGFCKEFITKNYRPLPGNDNGVKIRVHVIFARSIPSNSIEEIYSRYFHVDVAGANVRQDWYPPIWKPLSSSGHRSMRPTLSAQKKNFDVPFIEEKPEIRFDCLHPEFADEYGNENRWANVVRVEDWSRKDQVATVVPTDYKKPISKYGTGPEEAVSTTEGFVIFRHYKNTVERWGLQDGTTAINHWLKSHNIDAVLSDAGRSTQQIIQTLGGFWGVARFAHRDIVELLNEISRRPALRSIQHQQFKNRIENAVKGDIWRHRNFETLVERNAVELGLEVKCAKCSSWSWYSLKQLDYQMTCGLCLRQFKFPIVDPSGKNSSRWAYRLIGPFALPDYARGGYAASLSIRFFSDVVGKSDRADVTWSAGQVLDLSSKRKVEADFILWYQRKRSFANDHPTDIVFGEAKSFGKEAFQSEDVDRMKVLAEEFPGAVLVFSTMKEAQELSKEEISRIAKLAEWGREYIKEKRQTRAPVIVLTGTELFTPFSLDDSWKNKGGKHEQLIEPAWIRTDNLRVLADLTQQLYLNMPSYSDWSQAKWKKRAERKKWLTEQKAAPPNA